MITASEQNLSEVEYKDETFGDLSLCNFQDARFENCVFTGTVYGCNFTDSVFSACAVATAVFNACNFMGATGLNPADITGDVNNFEDVG